MGFETKGRAEFWEKVKKQKTAITIGSNGVNNNNYNNNNNNHNHNHNHNNNNNNWTDRSKDGRTDRPTDGHTLLKRCENAFKTTASYPPWKVRPNHSSGLFLEFRVFISLLKQLLTEARERTDSNSEDLLNVELRSSGANLATR